MNNSPSAIYVKDKEGHYLYGNTEVSRHFENKSVVGLTDYALFPLTIAEDIRKNDMEVLRNCEALKLEEPIVVDGSRRYYATIKFPIIDDSGNIYALGGISTDITENKLQEEKLRRGEKMEALGKLTGGVAHDFNNILGIILGFADLIEKSIKEQPKLFRYTQQITQASERGAKLVKQMLAFSGQFPDVAKAIDLNQLLLRNREMIEKSLTPRISLHFNLKSDIWPVFVEESSFEDTLLNLCINAMQAIDGEGGHVTLSTRNLDLTNTEAIRHDLPDGEYVLFSVSDTGCGMNEQTKSHIFEPFFTTKEHQGTGLGLSQVYGFVERSNGAINVITSPGVGTEIQIYFPRG